MLKAVVSDLSTVDEPLRGLYEEKAGKFVLKVEPVDGVALENVTGLRTALAAERATVAEVTNKLKPFEGLDVNAARTAIERATKFGDLDPDDVKTKLTAFERLSAIDPEKEADRLANERLNNAKTQLKATHDREKGELSEKLTAAEQLLEQRNTQVNKLLKQNTITTELAKLDPLDEARDVLEMLAAQSIKLIDVAGEARPVVVDANGNPRTKIDPSSPTYASVPFTVAELMAEIKEARPVLFKPSNPVAGLGLPAGNGTRTPSSGEVNPWAKATTNKTMQVFLEAKDPARAARLKAEAGAA